jgi:hypothetical protein
MSFREFAFKKKIVLQFQGAELANIRQGRGTDVEGSRHVEPATFTVDQFEFFGGCPPGNDFRIGFITAISWRCELYIPFIAPLMEVELTPYHPASGDTSRSIITNRPIIGHVKVSGEQNVLIYERHNGGELASLG